MLKTLPVGRIHWSDNEQSEQVTYAHEDSEVE